MAAGFDENLNYLSDAIKAWKQEAEAGGERVNGLQTISHDTQLFRAECLEEFMAAGCEVTKISHLRQFLTSLGGVDSRRAFASRGDLPPTDRHQGAEQGHRRAELKSAWPWCGAYFDETTHCGAAFAQCTRATKSGSCQVQMRCIEVSWLQGCLANQQVSATVVRGTSRKQISMDNVFTFHCDACAVNPQ